MGQCSACHEWNTIVEEVVRKESKTGTTSFSSKESERRKPQPILEIKTDETTRWPSSDKELNRVLGGGIVPGSIILLGGEPGIGKSTLSLQIATQQLGKKVLYVSGEESAEQIGMRAQRLGAYNDDCLLLAETNTQQILHHIEQVQPELVVVDSIQTLHSELIESAPGSVSQIRQSAAEIQRMAKETATAVIFIGHITKDGSIAGPKVLEHMVDTVLQFEGDRQHMYRLLRARKNRFGSTAELGIYEMREKGLFAVGNPSAALIGNKDSELSGVAIASTMEGMRPLLIEVQALVSSAVYGNPQRSATGFDIRRLNMLLAVLEKRCGFKLGTKDVFLNIAGGLRVDDPAIDLAVVAAVLSSNEDIPVDAKTCLAAEIGLTGEVRSVDRLEQRISEAQKLGFERIICSGYSKIDPSNHRIEVIGCRRIEEVFQHLFG
jgi:DNA repair protein RadA/Sms